MSTIACGPTKVTNQVLKIRFEVSGWESLKATPTITIEPRWVHVEYTPNFTWVMVSGPRINAKGLGADHDKTLWWSEWPGWLVIEIQNRAPEWWEGG